MALPENERSAENDGIGFCSDCGVVVSRYHAYNQPLFHPDSGRQVRIACPVLTNLPEPKRNHCSGCGWSSGGHDPRCPIPPASSEVESR